MVAQGCLCYGFLLSQNDTVVQQHAAVRTPHQWLTSDHVCSTAAQQATVRSRPADMLLLHEILPICRPSSPSALARRILPECACQAKVIAAQGAAAAGGHCRLLTLGPRVTPTTVASLSAPACIFFNASMFLLKCSSLAARTTWVRLNNISEGSCEPGAQDSQHVHTWNPPMGQHALPMHVCRAQRVRMLPADTCGDSRSIRVNDSRQNRLLQGLLHFAIVQRTYIPT